MRAPREALLAPLLLATKPGPNYSVINFFAADCVFMGFGAQNTLNRKLKHLSIGTRPDVIRLLVLSLF